MNFSYLKTFLVQRPRLSLDQGLTNIFWRSQRVNSFNFAGLLVSVAITQLCYNSARAATDITDTMSVAALQ